MPAAKAAPLPWWVEALKLLATGAVAALATVVVGYFIFFNAGRELDIRMVDVGLSIMRGEATGEQRTIEARLFALRLLKRYAAVEIPDTEMQSWAESGTLPFRPVSSLLVLPDPFFEMARKVAAECYPDGSGTSTNVGVDCPGLKDYLLGMVLAMSGVVDLKRHVENPSQNPSGNGVTAPRITPLQIE